MFVPVLGIASHQRTQLCIKGQQRNKRRDEQKQQRLAKEVQFTIRGEPIERVSCFKYLGRWLSEDDDDMLAVRENVGKARARWGRVARVLARDGADTRTMARFYKAVVQSVLLFGSETWVLSKEMGRILESFHNRCARFMARDCIQQRPDGSWYHPNTALVLAKCDLSPISHYIEKRKQKIMGYIAHRPIYEQCTSSLPTALNANQLTWWS